MAYSKLTFHSLEFLCQLDSLFVCHAYLQFHRFRLHLDEDECAKSDEKNALCVYDHGEYVNDE